MKLSEITRRDFLKGMVGAAAAAVAAPALSAEKKPDPWRLLRDGMTQEQVHALLGEPSHIKSQQGLTVWRYGSGTVRFWKGVVSGWTEPR